MCEQKIKYLCFVHSDKPTEEFDTPEQAYQYYKTHVGCRVYRKYAVSKIYPRGMFERWL